MPIRFSHPSILLTTVLVASTLVAAALFSGAKGSEAVSSATLPPHVPGELLIKFRPEARQDDRLAVRAQLDANALHTFESGAQHWRLGPGITVEGALAALDGNEHLEYAEPNKLGRFTLEPGDVWYQAGYQWPLPKIQAPQAWNLTVGSQSVIIAATDTGIDPMHEDLFGNIWSNSVEMNGVAGVDDDGNGYVDDFHGWDFVDNDSFPMPTNPHGTQVAGIIGAQASEVPGGYGIAGLNWTVSLMNLRTGRARTGVDIASITKGVDYAYKNGAHIISMSVAFDCEAPPIGCSQTLKDSIKAAGDRDVIVIAAAGNEDRDVDSPSYLCCLPVEYDLPNIIGVAATDQNDNQADFMLCAGGSSKSNWGGTSVDVAAPGVCIWTDVPVGSSEDVAYPPVDGIAGGFGGTSAATPYVAGLAGLIKALSPDIPFELIKSHILDPTSLDPAPAYVPGGAHPTVTGGRINASKTIDDHDPNAPTPIGDLRMASRTTSSITLAWTATGDDGQTGTAALYKIRHSTSPITQANWLKAKWVGNEPTPAAPGTTQSMVVQYLPCATTFYFAMRAYDEWGNGPMSNVLQAATKTPLCPQSYCAEAGTRCSWSGSCGQGGCCNYQCVEDETCLAADTCPGQACYCAP